ncbi:MAG: hypothetical protein ACJA1B_002918 [Polaribacter sp.]|jgi:uncharacterized protein YbaP (TraB family)
MNNYLNTLKRIAFILFLTITFLIPKNGYSQEVSQKPYLLWKVSGNDLAKPSYIFGVNGAYKNSEMISELNEVLRTTEQLVLDLKKENTPEEASKIKQLIVNEAGAKYFYNQFDKATQKKLDDFFVTHYGADFKRLSAYKPFMISNLIESKIIPPYDITAELADFSKTHHQAIIGLETIEEQIEEFEKVPLSEQVKTITEFITNPEIAKERSDKIITYYKNQDIKGIYGELEEFEDTEMEKIMLEARNIKWLPQLTSLMKDKSSFIAIGVTHMLPFKNNLKDLLETEGYTITLVK